MNLNNWAYKFALNHEGAKVSNIYYAKRYFDKENIVNPKTAKKYTEEEINNIISGVKSDSNDYYFDTPNGALIGIENINHKCIYWYDDDNAKLILSSANPLILDNGNMFDTNGNIVARAFDEKTL